MASTNTTFCALVYLFLSSALLSINFTSALRCYICGGEKELQCKYFQNSDKFIKECSVDEKSCRTSNSKRGNQVLERSCESNLLDDCSTANNITYCFCTSDLCNGDTFPTDDEDLIEGSGKNIEKNVVFSNNDGSTDKSSAFRFMLFFSMLVGLLILLFFGN